MARTTSETIKEITRKHLTEDNGVLLGQCVTAVGWIGGTVPDVENIIEIPMTDIAGPAFACGFALKGRRPIFVVRYQGFMWYNASSLVNYAAKSKEVWGQPCPIFIRSLGNEGNGVGHTGSGCIHSIFAHSPGMDVVAPMTPAEYQGIWDHWVEHDDPMYVSEHRSSFGITGEMEDQVNADADITLVAISASRLNALEAMSRLEKEGVRCNLIHQVWLKPFHKKEALLSALRASKRGLVLDTDYDLAGIARSMAYELTLDTGAEVHAMGLEDRVCGVAPRTENLTPSADKIVEKVHEILKR